MKINNKIEKHIINSDNLKFELLSSGDIFNINYLHDSISMYKATSLDGMMANIYLRITKGNDTFSTRLLGVNSPSTFKIKNNQILYEGEFHGVKYQVHFKIHHHTWFWTVKLKTEEDIDGELYYGQDVSLSSPFANEAYVCQYLDHQIHQFNSNYHIVTKQNQGNPLMIQQGSLTDNIAYATDGFDFFGKEYKRTNKIKALVEKQLPSVNYQYELAYISFQAPKVSLKIGYEAIFYASFNPNYHQNNFIDLSILKEDYHQIAMENFDDVKASQERLKISWENTYPYIPFSEEELSTMFPEKILIEERDGKTLSWFSPHGTHFVVGKKEDILERAHGNIIANQGMRTIDNIFMASTNWIYGIFNSQIVLGNSQFNRMITHNKTPLNILKDSGQRLFVKILDKYYLLTLPAIYQMDINVSTWYYRLDDDILKIEVGIAPIDNQIVMNVSSKNNQNYDFILTQQMVMSDVEYHYPIKMIINDEMVEFFFDENTLTHKFYPSYSFLTTISTDGQYQYFNDELFYSDGLSRDNPLFCIKIDQASSFDLRITGNARTDAIINSKSISELKKTYQDLHQESIRHFYLNIDLNNEHYQEIQKFNVLVPWYTHNALIHYSSPHGLEQYGGGAWGTRDICQGPVELFTAFSRFDLVRKVILKVYERQFYETGDWPQWFMFDKFEHIQADSSHADIIVWPLYIVGRYLLNTNDLDILEETVPYTSLKTGEKVAPATIYEHIKKQLQTIKDNFIPGTHLSSYGGGDWDDTLQPCNPESRTAMVSSWTVALTIQTLDTFLDILDDNDEIRSLVTKMKADFHKYLIADHIPAGFIDLKDHIKYILHPRDQVTGIKYRLLTFNQGMIAELFDEKDINKYLDIIDQNLMHPDGVRLMNTTVKYQGGIPKIFTRAETATNFGREIGLQYVHAHIRYLEAMAKIGDAERLFSGLKVINPVLIEDTVKNAMPRQSNVYFSSSDGNFRNRYEADADFDKLRTGEVGVKGGWRLYSSGPGIYLNQLICNFLGINTLQNDLYIDPVLPKSLSGLNLIFQMKNYHLDITYEITSGHLEHIIVNGQKINRNTALLKYRSSGVLIPTAYLQEHNKIFVKM